jgi:hypothetical protein
LRQASVKSPVPISMNLFRTLSCVLFSLKFLTCTWVQDNSNQNFQRSQVS